jgi:hypothetical protein
MNSTEKIRELNDQFRQTMRGGRLMLTRGIVGRDDTNAILDRVRQFNTLSEGNDPYGEHDFGAFDHAGDKVFWKIDYYDPELVQGSEDPSDPAVTTRVLTIMLADEY